MILYTCLWVNKTTLVGDRAITSDKDVIGNCLSEDFDLENIRNDFFGLTINVGVHESDVVVACNNVSECGKSLFYTLNGHGIGEGVPQVLELLVGSCRWHEETVTVS